MKMDYILLSATALEQEWIICQLKNRHTETHHARSWNFGSFDGADVLLVEGGIGLVNTAMALTLALSRYETRRVLQFGVGGAYDRSSLQVGDLAVATNECYGDAGVITPKGWIDLQGMNLPLIPPDVDESSRSRRNILYNQIPMDIDLIKRVGGLLKAEAKQIREGTTDERPVNGRTMKERFSKDQAIVLGTFVTVQQCSGVKSVGDEMANRFAGICENMEGAAAAHVALLHEVSFAEIRGISNRVVDRDLSRWNLVLAARNSQHAIRAIVSAGL